MKRGILHYAFRALRLSSFVLIRRGKYVIKFYIIKQETELFKKFKMCVVFEDKIRGDTLLKEILREGLFF